MPLGRIPAVLVHILVHAYLLLRGVEEIGEYVYEYALCNSDTLSSLQISFPCHEHTHNIGESTFPLGDILPATHLTYREDI
jgi:hypothetical protein